MSEVDVVVSTVVVNIVVTLVETSVMTLVVTTITDMAAMTTTSASKAVTALTAVTAMHGRQQPTQDIFYIVTINLVWLVAKVQTRSVYNVKRLCGER